ncbi:MAG: glycerol kinase GlpK [Deltaproteobacteria bacterium]|nr:MAG: glycerol kinase GlpK [Deltaproteobacteria bacterium]
MKYILAIDQGTTGTTALLIDKESRIVSRAYSEFPQIYPKPGWVEHDPEVIMQTTHKVIAELLKETDEIAAIGITNQRETLVMWDKRTGKPVHHAIVWQCRRTADICEGLEKQGLGKTIREKTGLPIDAYFSATKIKWLLENVEKARHRDVVCGTIDSWLVYNLSGKHVTDHTNASRTMLYNINTLAWDEEILHELKIPGHILPEVKSSSEVYGYAMIGRKNIPIAGIAGDQQAALFGQLCFREGTAKNTYGTGAFTLMNIGEKVTRSNRLVTTIAYSIDGKASYALEGSIFIAGAAIQWLRDGLGIIKDATETEGLARSVEDSGGVYLVPAFVGLGAPHWDMYARGLIVGLTRGTKREHIVRAALESLAYQTKDVIEVMQRESGIKLKELKVDGGAARNDFLLQFQADILNKKVRRPKNVETTALGAAYLAGLATGYWHKKEEIRQEMDKTFEPVMNKEERKSLLKGWKEAVKRSKGWGKL